MLMECFISHVAAELLKLEDYIPPYATVSDYRILQGANFASGSSGIRDETGRHYVRYALSTSETQSKLLVLEIDEST